MMRYGKVAGIDKPVPRLVQGAIMINSREIERSFALLDGIFEQGGTMFDVAHNYGMGDVERTFGRWVRERGVRDQIVMLAKGAHPYDGRNRVTPEDITSDLHDTLERLQFDQIELYLLHRDDPLVPVGPIVEILNEHHRAGKIQAFGGSNWSYERISEANEYAAAHGLVPFAASSPNFSLAEQVNPPWAGCLTISGPQGAAARQWYSKQQMPLFTWSSLAGGFFTGRFRRDNLDSFTGGLEQTTVHAYGYEQNFQRLERAEALAAEKGVTLPQIALAYVINQPLNIFALTGVNTIDEWIANVQALDIELSANELAWLDLQRDER